VRPDGCLVRPNGQLFLCLKRNSETFSNSGKPFGLYSISVQTVGRTDVFVYFLDIQVV